jgi:hypothetical protein
LHDPDEVGGDSGASQPTYESSIVTRRMTALRLLPDRMLIIRYCILHKLRMEFGAPVDPRQ